ncbi:GNAT family N-acetyltransferase [Pseudomonas sp. NFX5]|uniref:GNAT family N-acetyltransferase n=1 Tax=Pseudomonas sp. NFX5 TaxID=2816961 RepID=UPI003B8D807A
MMKTSHMLSLAFAPVDLDAHLDVCQRFRLDAHACAFGSAGLYHSLNYGAEGYAAWLRQMAINLPGCLVHVWRNDEIIGQIEMGRVASDPSIGYVNFFYLIPELRGQGLGALLEAYAWSFLSRLGCQSLRLSASPTNVSAWSFYRHSGWQDLGLHENSCDVHLLHKHADSDAVGSPLVINPDDYLETEFGREFSAERNRQAWELAYARLSDELSKASRGAHVYLVMGVQGAGKSRWVSENLGRLGHHAIVFDAALPARRHRERVLGVAREHHVPVIAIFVKTSLNLALSRNARRSADKRVPEDAVNSVFGLLEPPTESEGFIWVQTIEQQASLPTTLQTARLKLVAPDVGFAEKLADALNASYELHRDFLVWSRPHFTLEDARESLKRVSEDFCTADAKKRYFLLQRDDDQSLVGCIWVSPIADQSHGFEIGYWVSQNHAARGLMKEALTALVSRLSGHPLRLITSSANIPSQKLAEAAGFERVEIILGARVSGRHGVCDALVYEREAR